MKLTLDQQSQLEPLIKKFAEFRRDRAGPRSPIPQALWEEVMALADQLPAAPIARLLGLDLGSLKKKLGLKKSVRGQRSQFKIQTPSAVRIAPVVFSGVATKDIAALEISRADGHRLFLQSITIETLAVVLTQFLQKAEA